MTIVLAALDSSAAARPVLETAISVAAITGSTVRAVHVREDGHEVPAALARAREVPLRELEGPVEEGLLHELGADEVIIGVIGARGTPAGARPVGHIALHVVERVAKPVVVVPPEALEVPARPTRLLVPLEGTEACAEPVVALLQPLLADDVDLVVVHVLTATTAPPMVDHPDWGLEHWSAEFLARHLPDAADLRIRTGPVGAEILQAAADAAVDAIVLCWSQDASPGHAAVVRTVLEHAPMPIFLLPAGPR